MDWKSSLCLPVHPGNPALTKTGLELVSEIGVRSFYVDWNSNTEKLLPRHLPSFKRPHLLRYFSLDGGIHPDVFNNLVKDTANLSILKMSPSVLHKMEKEDMDALNFTSVTELHLLGFRHGHDGFGNLMTLLQDTKFPHLTRLEIGFAVVSLSDLRALAGLVRFIQALHRLQEITVAILFPENMMRRTMTSGYEVEKKQIIDEIKANNFGQSVKVLRLKGSLAHAYFSQVQILKELLIKPRSLEEVWLGLGPVSNGFLEAFCSQNGTLKKLTIDPDNDNFEEMRRADHEFLRSRGIQEVSGTRNLPHTLEFLSLAGAMRSEEVDHILLGLPNLVSVNLQNSDIRQDDYLVSLQTLKQFVENRRVRSLKLRWIGDANRFPPEGIPNGDLVNPTMLTLDSSSFVDWKLNRDGFYINSSA